MIIVTEHDRYDGPLPSAALASNDPSANTFLLRSIRGGTGAVAFLATGGRIELEDLRGFTVVADRPRPLTNEGIDCI